jgi:hypothetical protein
MPTIQVEIKLYSKNYSLESSQTCPVLDYIKMMDWFVEATGHVVNPGYLEINYWDRNGQMETTWSDFEETGLVTVIKAQDQMKQNWDDLCLVEVVYHHYKSSIASAGLSEERIKRSLSYFKQTYPGLANMAIE